MTAQRRLDKVEAALTPTQRVLAWLDEAHAWGTLSAYVDSLLDKSPDHFPINRLAADAATGTRGALRGKPPETVAAAVRKSVLATVFRFHLVLRINVVAHETIDRETLIYVAMAGQLALLGRDDRPERLTDDSHLSRLAQSRDITMSRVDHWLALQQARSMAEERYLDGRAAVFPDTAADEAARLRASMELAVMADAIAELDGLGPVEPTEPEAITARADLLVADLVEPARVTTLEQFDEGRQGLEIATAWLRSKASRAADDLDQAALKPRHYDHIGFGRHTPSNICESRYREAGRGWAFHDRAEPNGSTRHRLSGCRATGRHSRVVLQASTARSDRLAGSSPG